MLDLISYREIFQTSRVLGNQTVISAEKKGTEIMVLHEYHNGNGMKN